MRLSESILAFAEIKGINERKGKWNFEKRIHAGEYRVAKKKWLLREQFNHIFLKIFTDQ